MSHELRTPLNGVLGLAQALTATPLDHGQQEVVDELVASAGRLDELVGGLLAYDRPAAPLAEASAETRAGYACSWPTTTPPTAAWSS